MKANVNRADERWLTLANVDRSNEALLGSGRRNYGSIRTASDPLECNIAVCHAIARTWHYVSHGLRDCMFSYQRYVFAP